MPNEIIVSGRLVDNFSLRFTKEGQPWGFFRVASQEGKSTLFISVTVSDSLAEQLQELKKGDMVFVRGILRQRDYEKNGEKKTVYDIKAKQVETSGRLSSLTFSEQIKRVDNMELEEISPF